MAAPKRKRRLLSLPVTVRLTHRLVEVLNTVEDEYGPQPDPNHLDRTLPFSSKQPTLHASSTGIHVYVDEQAAEFQT